MKLSAPASKQMTGNTEMEGREPDCKGRISSPCRPCNGWARVQGLALPTREELASDQFFETENHLKSPSLAFTTEGSV